jgi:heterodisulfide reductase subunit B
MKFAFFPGCRIPYFLEHYGVSTRLVLQALGVELVDLEFNCCGYPIRNLSLAASLLSAARNLAIAEQQGLDILTPCKCCLGGLKHAEHWLLKRPDLREETARSLGEEGLTWRGEVRVKHLLTVLCRDVGLEAIKARVSRPFKGLTVAAHYGCHALRPGSIMRFDNPLAPTLFEELVSVTGAGSVDWPRRLECCGHPLWEKKDPVSLAIMRAKVSSAREARADVLCTACTYCQIQFDTIQDAHPAREETPTPLPAILYPQLLGLSMGLPESSLGMERNRLDLRVVRQCLQEEGVHG